jgi:hypothetical protein
VSRKRTETSIAIEINGIPLDRLNNNGLQDLKKTADVWYALVSIALG